MCARRKMKEPSRQERGGTCGSMDVCSRSSKERFGEGHLSQVMLVTGCSSGIGMHTAVQAAMAGYEVWATMRDVSKDEKLRTLASTSGIQVMTSFDACGQKDSVGCSGEIVVDRLDVQDESSIQLSVERLLSRYGTLDVVVNCAGVGMLGTVETCTIQEIRSHFDINVLGAVRLIHHTMPMLRARGKGRMIFLSSVSGFRAIPCSEIYAGSKHALEGILEGFAAVARLSGVHITIMEPGPVQTNFLENLKDNVGSRYMGEGNLLTKLMEKFATHNSARLSSETLPSGDDMAMQIIQAVNASEPPLRLQPDDYSKHCAANVLVEPSGQQSSQRSKQFILDLYSGSLEQS